MLYIGDFVSGEQATHGLLGGEWQGGRPASSGPTRRSRRWQPARVQVRHSCPSTVLN
jgi:hypothetical protein